MKWFYFFFAVLFISSCQQSGKNKHVPAVTATNNSQRDTLANLSYTEVKEQIAAQRKVLAAAYIAADEVGRKTIREKACQLWVSNIGQHLYQQWLGTPWDYNGTTQIPKQGAIACGYFVNTLLQDMGLKINRVKLSTCAASEMMQQVVPQQKIKKLNTLSFPAFCDSLLHLGKGVYIIGLDYHVGFIVNDRQSVWVVHSFYVDRKGVTKEAVSLSASLFYSNTKWLVSLTGDIAFIERWLGVK